MQSTLNPMPFLWTAYLLVGFANVAFVVWLATSWSKLTRGDR